MPRFALAALVLAACGGAATRPPASIAARPGCVDEGVYEVTPVSPTWTMTGEGDCTMPDIWGVTTVRVAMRGGQLRIDNVFTPPYDHSEGTATVTGPLGGARCEVQMSLDFQDYHLVRSTVAFEHHRPITGTTDDFTYDVLEDGPEGRGLWSCHTSSAKLVWKRIAN